MALDAISTLADALAQLNANLLWMDSPAKARLFYEAALWLRQNRPTATSDGGASVSYAPSDETIAAVEKYIRTVGNANRASFTTARGIID
jgi:hypothetical protein